MHGALLALVAGLALLVLAALRDRQTRRRAERAALESAPAIPGLPAEEPRPHYVAASTPALVRRPEPFTAEQLRTVQQWCAGSTAMPLRLAGEQLATHLDPPTSVLHDALVLACSQGIGSVRELLPTAERAVREHRALLVATTTCSPEVLDTLRVNLRAGRLSSCVVLGDADSVDSCCAATGAIDVARATLQSGAALQSELGRAARVVATEEATWVGDDTD